MKPFDFRRDEAVPEWLRDSLLTNPFEGFRCEGQTSATKMAISDGTGDTKEKILYESATSCNEGGQHLNEGQELKQHDTASDSEDNWELAQECQANIADCCKSFDGNQNGHLSLQSSSCMGYIMPTTTEVGFSSTSSISAVVKVSSSMSLFDLSDHARKDFLTITGIVPLRNQNVILHWKVKSTYGIRGFKVFYEKSANFLDDLHSLLLSQISVDGVLALSIHSPERTSALIKNVDMNEPHHFTVSVILAHESFATNLQRRFSFTKPAIFYHE